MLFFTLEDTNSTGKSIALWILADYSTCTSPVFTSITKWLDKSVYVETVLKDIIKAYDCLYHDLVIAKLELYGLTSIVTFPIESKEQILDRCFNWDTPRLYFWSYSIQ